jgi:hypothetical protein
MKHYLALLGIFCLTQVFLNKSSRLFSHNPCKKKYTLNNCFGSKKINKAIKTFLIKSEKIKNILTYPEPDDKEDWESGEIPWDPKNTTDYNKKKKSNDTYIMVGDIPVNPLTPLNINDVAMLFV